MKTLPLMPHQEELVRTIAEAQDEAKIWLRSVTGAGASTALLRALLERWKQEAEPEPSRHLIVTDRRVLLAQWHDRLHASTEAPIFIIDPPGLRKLELHSGDSRIIYAGAGFYLATEQMLARLSESADLTRVCWDTVVATPGTYDVYKTALRASCLIIRTNMHGPDSPGGSWQEINWDSRSLRETAHSLNVVFPGREVAIYEYSLSTLERAFLESVRESSWSSLGPQGEVKRNIMLRRLRSSLFAVEQTLRRMRLTESPSKDVRHIDGASIEYALELFERIPEDSKMAACRGLVEDLAGSPAPVVIFTDFLDTLEYIASSLSFDWPVFSISGSTSLEARDRLLDGAIRAADSEGHAVLVVTTAGSDGLSLSFAQEAIHYDLPGTPQSLSARFGRLERIGSSFETIRHHFLASDWHPSTAEIRQMLSGVGDPGL